jgi:hypothetical protein
MFFKVIPLRTRRHRAQGEKKHYTASTKQPWKRKASSAQRKAAGCHHPAKRLSVLGSCRARDVLNRNTKTGEAQQRRSHTSSSRAGTRPPSSPLYRYNDRTPRQFFRFLQIVLGHCGFRGRDRSRIAVPLDLTATIVFACRRLGLKEPVHGTAKLFSGEATGLLVHLPEWHYPVVIDTLTGVARFDNFNGRWGNQEHLHAFFQMYSVEKAKIEARRRRRAVSEQQLTDGSIRLQMV